MLNPMRHWARVRQWTAVGGPPLAAAVLGNALIGKEAMGWFRQLKAPRMQLPLPAFGVVGAVYYLELGVVLYRAHRNDDRRVRRLALLVLAGNELWNVSFFGRRDPRAGFLGIVAFLAPLLALQKAVVPDRPSVLALTPYTLWVIGYDLPWTFRLWRLNRVARR
jgi:benzodiazapine receptor